MSVCDDADDRSHLPSIPRLWLELETVLGFLVLGLGPGACPGWYFFLGGGAESAVVRGQMSEEGKCRTFEIDAACCIC